MTIGWHFDNTYSKLSNTFKEEVKPTPVHNPELVVLNDQLAKDLNLDFSKIEKKDLSQIFSGNTLPKGSTTIAQAYAGHQFGHFTMLGDGRAVLLGEHLVNNTNRYDVQFKGSGRTSFSRSGDGRAVLGPMLREYIISEAIHALKIPTTRSLAVVKTGEKVVRENLLPGAILTRVASSHIRVGTFQYIAAKQNIDDLNTLVDYTINRHYPEIQSSKNKALDLLNLVMERQCKLVVNWMRVGFIHGVMNTDNMTISGETIDYGPCAFMDHYNPKTVFSSIDQFGRYSFSNQPPITKWNLSRFAECLIPLIDKNEDKAIQLATEIIDNFQNIYEEKWHNMMRDKLGLFGKSKDDKKLIDDLLSWMEKNKADYTNTFCYLMNIKIGNNSLYNDKDFINWSNEWQNRISINDNSKEKSLELMKETNPVIIPRNHKVEEALKAANEDNLEVMNKMLSKFDNPYDEQKDIEDYQLPSLDDNYQTFCGT
ncbi:YdiU family protein [bacterium]|nr:YdiU family protein [Candidatus Pelagibacter sp.]MDB3986817.1 YdiU family protein [bacterium]MDB4811960.1 YdiU family protein [Candidatus Pelagibacter sp.]MDC0465181.1 YdiU family protein [Candidatus Pelagibacter sp.]